MNERERVVGPLPSSLPPTPRPWRLAVTFRSLQHRNYRLYFFGQMVSLIGTWMQTTALVWMAYALTEQSRWPAFVMAAQILPTFLFGAWGGWLADHQPKRQLIFRTQLAFLAIAVALMLLIASGHTEAWHLVLIMGIHGLVQAIDLPARLAFVPNLVPPADLINAVALNSLLFNVARTTGPAIAGIILVEFGPLACFVLNVLSYFAVLLALRWMQFDTEPVASVHASKKASLFSGFRVLTEQPRLAWMIALAGGLAATGWPMMNLLPALTREVFHLAEGSYSFLLSSIGIGALGAALSVATFGTPERQRKFLIAGLGMVALALLSLSAAQQLWVASLCCAGFGFGMILFFATGQSAVQLRTNDQSRGRIMGIWAMMLSGSVPLGNLLLGPLADRIGVPLVILGQAIAASLLCLTAAYLFLRHREFLTRSELTNSGKPLN
ncbi:MFS transporter [Tuwongella immobilis]|uniref:Major facilitator superfamily (MFS) profile domain-containing protein n=1 Tax=Tuwongella immobilis TaxID=692036 RepID=A0A6C2YQL0_9BACT|nr:MFS transporter [Tuwongella immobilis]VIP03393.1 Uncharacterized protein OS=uncultured bacterium GN=ACD_20C00298G0003 PE=4 SV=1: MFS_3 [Tuwongella immobilis]VTS04158.1 Uncharacterized protein OS=uncultured bacterium GN=ACD_20C00298G0003 PE=4 SV=1: MFS_3 [Tuwongella immobilis]